MPLLSVKIDQEPIYFAEGEASRFRSDLAQFSASGHPCAGLYKTSGTVHQEQFINFSNIKFVWFETKDQPDGKAGDPI